MAVGHVAGDVIEIHFQQAGEWTNLRRYGGAGGRGFVDKAHDVVAICPVVDSGIHDGSGGEAKATAGRTITARTTGRTAQLTRFVKRHRTVGTICCRGHGLERIPSLL